MSNTAVVPLEALDGFVDGCLAAVDVPPDERSLIRTALIEADLRGVATHGVARLPAYARAFRTGAINTAPTLRHLGGRGAMARYHGDNGLGLATGQRAMDLAIELAREHGMGWVGVNHANHAGMLAVHVLRAVAQGMIGYFVCNGPAIMAPWGGREALLSNNPFAYAFPGVTPPLVLDMACSAVARGRIRQAALREESIAEGWALDARGRPTVDAHAAMEGLVLPFGGHKGSGLAFVNEVLAAVMTGATLSVDVPRGFLREGATELEPWGIGFVAMAVDPSAVMDTGEFVRAITALRERAKAVQPAHGHTEVLLAGEPEWAHRERALRSGVPVHVATVAQLAALAEELGAAALATG